MGTYKQIEPDEILYNTIKTTPTHMYLSGNYNWFFEESISGTIMLYDEPFSKAGSSVVYCGFEEGDVRALLDKRNLSGSIHYSLIQSSSATNKDLAKYKTAKLYLSASSVYYPSHIDFDYPDKIGLIDIPSVFYDKKAKDFLMCWCIGRATSTGAADNYEKDFITAYGLKFTMRNGSLITYHDHSGSIRVGRHNYLYKDDHGTWRYNISASMQDNAAVAVVTANSYTTTNINNNTKVGYFIPEHGLGVITHGTIISSSVTHLDYTATDIPYHLRLAFFHVEGSHEIPVTTFLCSANKGELNYSNNVTYYKSGSASSLLYHSGSSVVYISKIGLYNKERRLVAVAQLAQPIRKKSNEQLLFKLTLHR